MSNNKAVITRYNHGIALVEGDIDGVTYCWVEQWGDRMSEYTDIDTATELAENMQEDESREEEE